jgi:hypothetical protein
MLAENRLDELVPEGMDARSKHGNEKKDVAAALLELRPRRFDATTENLLPVRTAGQRYPRSDSPRSKVNSARTLGGDDRHIAHAQNYPRPQRWNPTR